MNWVLCIPFVVIIIGITMQQSYCGILSRSSGQWEPTNHAVVGENGESYVKINEWAHRQLYGHGIQEDFSDESVESGKERTIRENEAYFYDVDNWAHEKLYGHKNNEDFSDESEEKVFKGIVNGNDDAFDKKDWELYTYGMNDITSQESTESRKDSQMGEITEPVDGNWAYTRPDGHRSDEDILNNID